MSSIRTLIGSVALLTAGGSAQASIVFTADLTNDQETHVVVPTTTGGQPRAISYGNGTFVLNDAMTELTVEITVYNIDVTGSQTADINDNLINAHIHAPASTGVNGPVVWGFFGAPDNDNSPDDLVIVPFAGDVGGIFTTKWDLTEGNSGTTLAAQIANLLAGLAYVNFHTVQFAGGEIRGQILPPERVPEPAALVLFGLGIVGLGIARRRRIV